MESERGAARRGEEDAPGQRVFKAIPQPLPLRHMDKAMEIV